MDQIITYLPGVMLAYAAFLLGIMSPGPNILAEQADGQAQRTAFV